MKTSTLNKINSRLKNIPDNFEDDIISYLDFLSFKTNTNDWAIDLNSKEIQLIKAGAADIKNGKVLSNTEALKKIKAHLRSKRK
jgi:hypothetical protein